MSAASLPSPASPLAPSLPSPASLAYDLFDCVQVNLAVLADRWHGAGTHLRLGATLRFRPVPGPDGLPTVERTVEQHLADAERHLGIVSGELRREVPAAEIRPAEGCYVVADAYRLPWVPYFERRHMEHSFLAETGGPGGVAIVDGYHNETPWGSTRPGQWSLGNAEFADAVSVAPLVARLTPTPVGHAASVRDCDLAGPDAIAAYVAAYAKHPDRTAALSRLALETWLLARSRKLHAAFLEGSGEPFDANAITAHLRAWDSLTEQVYLALRRVERGRAEPQGLFARLTERLGTDAVLFGNQAVESAAVTTDGCVPDAPEELRRTVAGVAAAVLGADPAALLAGQLLTDLPTFSSFRIVEIVERLEDELRIEFDADELVPENLHHTDAICGAVRRSLAVDTQPMPPPYGDAR